VLCYFHRKIAFATTIFSRFPYMESGFFMLKNGGIDVNFSLYAITGEQFHPGKDLVAVMEEAIKGGADIIQLRDKDSSKRDVLKKAKRLRELTAKYKVTFIVNDHIDIAIAVDADGVHLGQGDLPLSEARKVLGKDKIIGISTHRIDEAREAEQNGADYIGVGPVFPTKSKKDVVDPVTTNYVRQVANEISIPFVAIGGIKLHNVDEVLEAGATRICAISEIVGSNDVKGVCEQFRAKIAHQKGVTQ
jgi:thiamine-phosphate pyrophosphorylase